MTQEEKELLLKDLCARLPYSVSVNYKGDIYDVLGVSHGRLIFCKPFMSHTLEYCPLVEEVKPHLFPLSSMTEKQEKEWRYTLSSDGNITYDTVDWCNENHLDYRGLIPMGLAIDATNLNIY